ncbi:MAG: YdcF family protein [candidate division NC10 bacterium]|nr:YdcF family protein [candidate division NC10 bacterium]MDE2321766.1 YdcF family protein [candidate division NC10 bacterium]
MIGKLIRWLIVFPLLGLLLYVGYPFLLRAMGRYLMTEDRLQKAEAIAVLAGDGGVGRTLEAIRLYQDGYAPRIILTNQRLPKGYEALARLGITVPEERNIQWMVLKAMRVPATVVLQVSERANSTESEMVYLVRLLKEHRIGTVILVTDRSHSTRASKILARVSGGRIAIISRPTRYDTFDPEGWWRSRADAKEVVLEYGKLLNYLVQSASAGLTGWLRGGSSQVVPAEVTF